MQFPKVRLARQHHELPRSTAGSNDTGGTSYPFSAQHQGNSSCQPVVVTTPITFLVSSSSTIVSTISATYSPKCIDFHAPAGATVTPGNRQFEASGTPDDVPTSSLRDPFFISIIPMAYTIAMTITISYILFFLLLLSTPRPWLQKVATFTVVVSLTIAFAETTRILADEYSLRGENWMAQTENGSANEIRQKVVTGTVIRVGRIISDTFLWLAQVQTLIRLFPRHKEKIIIKWSGCALIVLDTIFSILVYTVSSQAPNTLESFMDAVPGISYLFQIALSLLYAACVIYYSLSSRIRRFAYYHPKAPNNIIIALLSIVSVAIPMVFFCLDIAQKGMAEWGDYVRWVGAAAASVVVWEWVDRIERLEREERKEGVLGREIFDGDDGLVEDMGLSQEEISEERNSRDSSGSRDNGQNGNGQGDGGNGGDGSITAYATGTGGVFDSPAVHRHSRSLQAAPFTHGSQNQIVANASYLKGNVTPTFIQGDLQPYAGTNNIGTLQDGNRSGESLEIAESGAINEMNSNSTESSKEARAADTSCISSAAPDKNSDGAIQNPSKFRWFNSFTKILSPFPSSGSSNSERKFKKRPGSPEPRRPLPITIIQAPARGCGVSLRELEEARRKGNNGSAVPIVVQTAKEQAAANRNSSRIDPIFPLQQNASQRNNNNSALLTSTHASNSACTTRSPSSSQRIPPHLHSSPFSYSSVAYYRSHSQSQQLSLPPSVLNSTSRQSHHHYYSPYSQSLVPPPPPPPPPLPPASPHVPPHSTHSLSLISSPISLAAPTSESGATSLSGHNPGTVAEQNGPSSAIMRGARATPSPPPAPLPEESVPNTNNSADGT